MEDKAGSPVAPPIPCKSRAVVGSIIAWLEELHAPHLGDCVLRWAEEMGAASLEEVVECVDWLVPALEECACKGEHPESQRLRTDAEKALNRVKAKAKATAAAANAARTWKHEDCSSNAGRLQSQSSSGGVAENQTTPLNADWPGLILRERQGKKKRDRLQSRKAAQAESMRGTGEESSDAAREKLELQLREEEERKTKEVLDALELAIAGGEMMPLTEAIRRMEDIGLSSHARMAEARQKHEQVARRHQQRCEEAVCALQAAVEAPRDDDFGQIVREALAGARDAKQANGGIKAVQEASKALRIWEEVRMALQVAMRSRQRAAIEMACEQAKDFGASPLHSLLAEARAFLQTLAADGQESTEARPR